MTGEKLINFIIGISGLSVCVLGLAQAISTRSMEKRTRQYFIVFFSLLVAYVATSLITRFGSGVKAWKTALFFESAFSSLLTPLLTCFLLEMCGEPNLRRSAAFRIAVGLESVYLALLIYTQFSTSIYYYDASGLYHRGPCYPLLLALPVGIMLVNLSVLWNRKGRLSMQERTAFAVYILFPMACMMVQMIHYGSRTWSRP